MEWSYETQGNYKEDPVRGGILKLEKHIKLAQLSIHSLDPFRGQLNQARTHKQAIKILTGITRVIERFTPLLPTPEITSIIDDFLRKISRWGVLF
jgi:hypothetical protein